MSTDGTYRKTPKNSDTRKNCCNDTKIRTVSFNYRVTSPKDAGGMAKRVHVDPDQTALEDPSDLGLLCPDLSVRKLRIVTVMKDLNGAANRMYIYRCKLRTSALFLLISIVRLKTIPFNIYLHLKTHLGQSMFIWSP